MSKNLFRSPIQTKVDKDVMTRQFTCHSHSARNSHIGSWLKLRQMLQFSTQTHSHRRDDADAVRGRINEFILILPLA